MDIQAQTAHVNMTLPKVERLANFIYWAILVVAVINIAFGVLTPRVDTDPPGARSGLRPYTDHATGCQYLATRDGALTPRLDASGKQICRKEL